MASVKVKICGTTNVQDAALCAEAGADALGFIFAPVSKRLVGVEAAREASLAVGPAVARVGVFMNQGLDEVLRVAERSRMTAVQLHGPLTPEYVQAAAQFYPVLRVAGPDDLRAEAGRWQAHPAVTLMLDAPAPGGGVPLDWATLRADFPAAAWLAGGLGPDNVAEAIAALRPVAVDAVSKLEARPGQKNPQAVKAFVDTVKGS